MSAYWATGYWSAGYWSPEYWSQPDPPQGTYWPTAYWANGFWASHYWGLNDPLAVNETPEVPPSGGWPAYFRREQAALRKRRQLQKELEEEADRLEAALIEEGIKPPDELTPALVHRVAAYASPALARRVIRAIEYAERTRTHEAFARALRELRKAEEDEDVALLVALAS